jgi:hypothetical protein
MKSDKITEDEKKEKVVATFIQILSRSPGSSICPNVAN